MSRKTRWIVTALVLTALAVLVFIIELFSSINRHIDACADPTSGAYIEDETLRKQECQD